MTNNPGLKKRCNTIINLMTMAAGDLDLLRNYTVHWSVNQSSIIGSQSVAQSFAVRWCQSVDQSGQSFSRVVVNQLWELDSQEVDISIESRE